MKRLIGIAGAVLLVAIVLVVIGVGGGSGGKTVPSSTVARAAATTGAARGYRVAIDATMRMSGLSGPAVMKGTGAVDAVHRRGAQTLDISGLPTGPMKMRQVFQGMVFYMSTPSLKAAARGKTWVKFDVRKAQRQLGIAMPAGMSSDPSQMVDQLRAVSGNVKQVGRERVRGTPATHYRATVDLRRYPRLAPPAKRAQVRAGVERLIELIGNSTMPEEVWIDAHRRIRRLKLDYRAHMTTVPGKPTMRMQMSEDLFAFGTPVDVKLPPADDVADITELMARGLPRPQ